MIYLLLFFEFFKTGLFSVGGGLATIPFLIKMTEKYPDWFGTLQIADIVAIAESTPGPIGVNAASFAGYSAAGVLGSVVASLALVLPSFIIVVLIARALQKYRDNRLVNDAFLGLRPAVTGLIAAACYSVTKSALLRGSISQLGFFGAFDLPCVILFAALFACTQIKALGKIHPIFYILVGAAFGILLRL